MSMSEESAESRRVFVGNLDYKADKNVLKSLFGKFGRVTDVYTPFDTTKGDKSNKGFAFVEMSSHIEAQASVDGLSGKEGPGGRKLIVKMAQPRTSNAIQGQVPRMREGV